MEKEITVNQLIYKFIEDNCIGKMQCINCHNFVKHSIYSEQYTCFLLEISEHFENNEWIEVTDEHTDNNDSSSNNS